MRSSTALVVAVVPTAAFFPPEMRPKTADRDAILLGIVRLGAMPKLSRLAAYLRTSIPDIDDTIDESIAGLAGDGAVELWGTFGVDLRIAITPAIAQRLGIELNSKQKWRSVKRNVRGYRVRRQERMLDYEEAVLDAQSRGRTLDLFAREYPPPDLDTIQRQAHVMTGERAWPVEGQDRGPAGPELDPRDDPRGVAKARGWGACPVCGNTTDRRVCCLASDHPKLTARLAEPPNPKEGEEAKRLGRFYLKAKVKPGLKGGKGKG